LPIFGKFKDYIFLVNFKVEKLLTGLIFQVKNAVCLVGWWVGLGALGQNKMCCKLCRLVSGFAALFILQKCWNFVCHFTVRSMSVVSSFTVAPNDQVWQAGGDLKELSFPRGRMVERKRNCP